MSFICICPMLNCTQNIANPKGFYKKYYKHILFYII